MLKLIYNLTDFYLSYWRFGRYKIREKTELSVGKHYGY